MARALLSPILISLSVVGSAAVASATVASVTAATTPGGGTGCSEEGTCPSQSSSLIQAARKGQKLAVQAAEEPGHARAHVWRSEKSAGSALEYFRWWAAGKVEHSMSTTLRDVELGHGEVGLAQADESATTELKAQAMVQALAQYRGPCSESEDWSLHQGVLDERGVQHALLRSSLGGKLQYVALHRGRVLVADPKACPGPALLQASQEPDAVSTSGNEILDSTSDKLVKDCIALFHETVKENCQKDFTDVEVLSARLEVIDGFAVFALINLKAADGTVFQHEPECEFEIPSSPDASLLQTQQLPEEKQGLTATLKMDIPICLADQQSSVSPQVASVMELMKTHRFGHLPLYKGYEHLGYGAKVVLPQLGQTPSDYDHRTVYPMCYPSGGQEVVRNQGNCGSCWAFASASALMANLCASGQGANALFSATDRYEVSVQGIMSCNANSQGCEGGNYLGTDSGLASAGIAKERDFKYKCGSGDSSKHFEEGAKSCEAAPWGATCSPTANPTWHYDGFTSVSGEDGIMGALVLGAAQYVSLKVNSGFMSYSSGVYSNSNGKVLGGHAVTGLGFGVESGQKYWLIQNSWGTNWGQGGFAKVVRGVGFMGIENRGTIIRGYVDGGSKLPCFDASTSGYSSGSGPLSCAYMKSYCTHSTYGSTVTNNCPVTCQKAGCESTTAPAATTEDVYSASKEDSYPASKEED
ncbi:unnamed protein product [Polarella glacialis]|uniref:Peptidase C1A papain C-terminal domain-containing protein n=1 Tax=Polarella glacialis TaxID=89957 RepID=A0A813JSY5_POLGL|nr:unnamed protein product [Polarella glacialis]